MKNVEQTAEFWIEHLKLQEHPEGGYFREVYRSEELIPRSALPERYNGARNFGTSIYYLLKGNQFSIFHKLHSDEIWHFYEGSAAIIYLLRPGCELETLYLGRDIAGGEQLQVLIPRESWFATEVRDPGSFMLAGCTVHPGFSFSDFVLAARDELINHFPKEKKLIERLARI